MRYYCLALLLALALPALGFAQTSGDSPALEFAAFSSLPSLFSEFPDFSVRVDLFRPVPLSNGAENEPDRPIFADSSQGVKDLRRGEIVFFGSLPFTVFFTRTFMDLYRTASHNWDTRYAPWPFASAGAVAMNFNELAVMFSIALSASLVVSVADHFIVRHKRKAAVPE
jgi:hypothetical protein